MRQFHSTLQSAIAAATRTNRQQMVIQLPIRTGEEKVQLMFDVRPFYNAYPPMRAIAGTSRAVIVAMTTPQRSN